MYYMYEYPKFGKAKKLGGFLLFVFGDCVGAKSAPALHRLITAWKVMLCFLVSLLSRALR